MAEIIPSINVRTFEELKNRIGRASSLARWVHLDVADGIFTKHLTWSNPKDLESLETELALEVHLMIASPENFLDQWLGRGVKRLFVQVEASNDLNLVLDKCLKAGVEAGLALNPETPSDRILPWVNLFDWILFLAVDPGPSGQEFQDIVYEKIRTLRLLYPGVKIEVDGGIKIEQIKKLKNLGVDGVVVGSALFGADDPKSVFSDFLKEIQ